MRKVIFGIAIALAVAGVGFAAGSMFDLELAMAGCTGRC
jgi:hypothetical protein